MREDTETGDEGELGPMDRAHSLADLISGATTASLTTRDLLAFPRLVEKQKDDRSQRGHRRHQQPLEVCCGGQAIEKAEQPDAADGVRRQPRRQRQKLPNRPRLQTGDAVGRPQFSRLERRAIDRVQRDKAWNREDRERDEVHGAKHRRRRLCPEREPDEGHRHSDGQQGETVSRTRHWRRLFAAQLAETGSCGDDGHDEPRRGGGDQRDGRLEDVLGYS